MICANAPAAGAVWQEAKCHVCGERKRCGFCRTCCHWFCDRCRVSARRVLAALTYDGAAACCGPEAGR